MNDVVVRSGLGCSVHGPCELELEWALLIPIPFYRDAMPPDRARAQIHGDLAGLCKKQWLIRRMQPARGGLHAIGSAYVTQNFVGMRGGIDLRQGVRDDAVLVDHERDARSVPCVGRRARAVGHCDGAVGIAEQREVVAELFGEGLVVGDTVEAEAEDLNVLGSKLV